jgi:hypothetical protein
VLKFVTDGQGDEPARVGLGLSFENLARLRADAIQFHGQDLDLEPPGVFVIAHAWDPQQALYRSLVGGPACELVVLDEATCLALKAGELVVRPLRVRRKGSPCEALLFAGPTEEAMAAAVQQRFAVREVTDLRGVPREARSFPVGWAHLGNVGLGAVTFAGLTALIVQQQGVDDGVVLGVQAMMAVTALVFAVLLALRWTERVEVDPVGVRAVRWWRPFDLRWAEISQVLAANDALGPYQLRLVTRDGRHCSLDRIYRDWDQLVAAISAR